MTCDGRLLHRWAAVTGNALSPTVDRRVRRTSRDVAEAERSRRNQRNKWSSADAWEKALQRLYSSDIRRIMLKLKAHNFFYPGLIWCPRSGWFCPNFQMNLTSPKTRMMELRRRPRDLSWIRLVQYRRVSVTDGRTDGRTDDGSTIAKLQTAEL